MSRGWLVKAVRLRNEEKNCTWLGGCAVCGGGVVVVDDIVIGGLVGVALRMMANYLLYRCRTVVTA